MDIFYEKNDMQSSMQKMINKFYKKKTIFYKKKKAIFYKKR